MTGFDLQPLRLTIEVETKPVLKKLAETHRHLAELKGIAATIPNESILIQTLALQEAKDSSEIENIVTTHDELFKAQLADESAQAQLPRKWPATSPPFLPGSTWSARHIS